MTDIVERLRDWSKQAGADFWAQDDAALLWEAADEITQLRAALRRIGMPGKEIGYCRDGHEIAVLIARDALKESQR